MSYLAAGGLIEMQERAADGGLAAAGFTDEAERFAPVDGEGNAVHGLEGSGAEKPGVDREILLEILDLDQRAVRVFRHACSPPSCFFSAAMVPFSRPALTFIQQAAA